MSNHGSVTRLLKEAQSEASNDAAIALWNRYINAVLGRASRVMQLAPNRIGDSNDVGQTVFASVILGIRDGRLPQIENRRNLWLALMRSTSKHAMRYVRAENKELNAEQLYLMEQLQFLEQEMEAPDKIGERAEQLARALEIAVPSLPTEDLRVTATKVLQGYTSKEIAQQLGLPDDHTVERRIDVILAYWGDTGR